MARCYVKAFFDWIEQTAALSDAERGRLFIAILEYARSGLDPKLDGREGILFPAFRSQIDRDMRAGEAHAKSGALGGRPETKNNQTKPNVTKNNQTKPKAPNKDKEEDKDKEEEKEVKEKASFSFDPVLQNAFLRWLEYKKERREPYKPQGLQSLIVQVKKHEELYGSGAVADLIEYCMAQNWRGIIFDRLKPAQTSRLPREQQNKKILDYL